MSHHADTLETLIGALLDRTITPEQMAALSQRIREDASTADRVAELMLLSSDATELMHTPRATRDAGVPVSAESLPIYRKGCEPRPRTIHVPLAIAAALLVACGLAIYVFTQTHEPSTPESHERSDRSAVPLATLIEHTGDGSLSTPGGFTVEGRDYGAGEYVLDAGTANFMLTNAVSVELIGETRLVMHDDMHVSLTRGSAAFVCPAEAKGFTLRLPDGSRVIDWGTAFNVTLHENGHSIVHVTDGAVHIASGAPLDEPTHELVAGDRAAIIEGRAFPIRSVSLSDIVGGGDGTGDHRAIAIDLHGRAVPYREVFVGSAARPDILIPDNAVFDRVFFPRGDHPVRSHPDAAPIADLGHGHSHGYLMPSVHADGSIYMHATSGITFDLDAIRKHHNGPPLRFVAIVQHFAQPAHRGNLDLAIVANDRVVHRQRLTRGKTTFPIDIAIPDDTRYLAFIATDGGDGLSGDGLIVRDALLLLTPSPEPPDTADPKPTSPETRPANTSPNDDRPHDL